MNLTSCFVKYVLLMTVIRINTKLLYCFPHCFVAKKECSHVHSDVQGCGLKTEIPNACHL